MAETSAAEIPARSFKVRVSHYWPPLGGTNCATFIDGKCVSKMSSGEPWEKWIDRAIACPLEWSFGTIVRVFDQDWTCMDTGGAIKFVDGIPWIDLLVEHSPVPYGTIVDAEVFILGKGYNE